MAGADEGSYAVEYDGREFRSADTALIEVVWSAYVGPEAGEAVDLGLLRVPGLPAVEPLPVAFLDRASSAQVGCTAVAFPTYADRFSVHLSGRLMLASEHRPREGESGMVTLQFDHDGPRLHGEHSDPGERWECASGGAVLAGAEAPDSPTGTQVCVGVVLQHVTAETARTLRVATFNPLDPNDPHRSLTPSQVSDFWRLIGQDPALTSRLPSGPRLGRIIAGERPQLPADFVVRPDERKVLDEALAGGTASLCALRGMRGVGKSLLPSAYAQDCERAGWDFAVWIKPRPASRRCVTWREWQRRWGRMSTAPHLRTMPLRSYDAGDGARPGAGVGSGSPGHPGVPE